jgi:membrane-associated phospholipid phosphatase
MAFHPVPPAHRPALPVLALVLALTGLVSPPGARAQDRPAAPRSILPDTAWSVDQRLLYRVYFEEDTTFQVAMRGTNITTFPVFYGGVAAAGIGVGLLRGEEDFADVYRLAASELVAVAGFSLLKRVFRRPRPNLSMPGIEARFDSPGTESFEYSFPSGHTAVAFALATSWSLSHPKVFVVVPGVAWAAATGVSRVWMGDHYPSDVIAGAVLGTLVAWGIHAAGDRIVPKVFLKDGDEAPDVPPDVPVFYFTFGL